MTDTATSGPAGTWGSAVRDQVRVVAGAWVDEAAQEWVRFAETAAVQVTVHGGYDAGKSSLIKRFLVEDGTPLPDDLAVGAKPTSTAVQRIASDGMVWVDTPGTAAGHADHDAIAEAALTLTDAVLIVLSPQLLSGDQDVVRGLLDGSLFNSVAKRPLFVPGSLVIAAGQMDTAGGSPWDDLDGYRRLIERKRGELEAALGKEAAAVAGHVHFVSADPNQAGLDEEPSREDYAGNEAWDGVAELRADLHSLVARTAELRTAASVRYWSWIAERARLQAQEEVVRLDAVLDESRRHDEVLDLVQEELDAVDRAARSRLRETIYERLLAGVILTDDRDAQRKDVEVALDATITAWLSEWAGKLDDLARRAETEQRVRAERPGADALRQYLDDLFTAPSRAPFGRPSADQLLLRMDEHVKTVARAGYKLLHGLSVDEARAELAGLRYLTPTQREQHFTGAEGLLTSKEHMDQVKMGVDRLEAFETMLPIMVELTSFVVGGMLDKRAELHRAELRAQLRVNADAIAEEIVAGGSGAQTWARAVESIRDAFTAARVAPDVLAQTEERRADLAHAAEGLTDLLSWADATRG